MYHLRVRNFTAATLLLLSGSQGAAPDQLTPEQKRLNFASLEG